MKTFPVATLGGSERWRNRRVDHTRPASNSDSLYLFTSEQSGVLSGYRDDMMACYEIYPASEDPHFSRLGTLSIYNVNQTTSSKDSLVCYQNRDSVFTVWKYTAQGLGVCWIFCQDDDRGDFYGMFICDGNLITFHTEFFCLWTIPDLTPLINGEATLIDSESFEPKLRLAYLSVDGGWLKVALPSCWLPESAQKQFGVYHDKNTIMAHYEVKSIDALQELGLPNILPIHSGSVLSSQNPFCRDMADLRPFHITEDGFLQTWSTWGRITFGILSKPSPNNPTYSYAKTSIWMGSGRAVQHDFCPMAGRLVVRVLSSASGPEIQIVDFIPPMSFSNAASVS